MLRTMGMRRRSALREAIRGQSGDTRRAAQTTRGTLYKRRTTSRKSTKRLPDHAGRAESLRPMVIGPAFGAHTPPALAPTIMRATLKQRLVVPKQPWIIKASRPKK